MTAQRGVRLVSVAAARVPLAGLAGLDPVGDDGVETGASLEEDERRRKRDETPEAK